jgi:hypothetical protein
MIAISGIYEVSGSVYFVSEGQTSQPATVTVGRIVTEECLLFTGELHNGPYDALLPVEKKD